MKHGNEVCKQKSRVFLSYLNLAGDAKQTRLFSAPSADSVSGDCSLSTQRERERHTQTHTHTHTHTHTNTYTHTCGSVSLHGAAVFYSSVELYCVCVRSGEHTSAL